MSWPLSGYAMSWHLTGVNGQNIVDPKLCQDIADS